MKTGTKLTGVCVVAMGLGAVAVSQDGMEFGQMPEIKPAEHQLAPAFDSSVISMERWMETTQTGKEHKMLDQLVGEWDVTQKLWMAPGGQPMVSQMKATTEWVLDGKHIRETLKGEFMGQPYEGMGITSYDKYNGRYNFYWADSMSTASYMSSGFPTADGGAIEAYGEMDEPMMNMRGKTVKYVLRAVDEDTHVFEIHDLHIGEPNTKVMELTYNRRK